MSKILNVRLCRKQRGIEICVDGYDTLFLVFQNIHKHSFQDIEKTINHID